MYFVFVFKHKTVFEFRISDWSSNVCSSDLDCLDWYGLNARTPVERSIESSLKPEDMAEILFTSGTTANPKGAIHTHSSAVHSSYSMTGAFLLDRDAVLQTFMPLFTSGGVRAFTCAL